MPPKNRPGKKPWITPPEKDGGADLQKKLLEMQEWAAITDDEQDIYYAMNTSADTWYRYKRLYQQQFKDALEKGWRASLTEIKRGMMQKAIDGDFPAQKFVLERKGGFIEKTEANNTHALQHNHTVNEIQSLPLDEKIAVLEKALNHLKSIKEENHAKKILKPSQDSKEIRQHEILQIDRPSQD